jgi:uncharacterized protein
MKRFLFTILFIIPVFFAIGQDVPARPTPPRLVTDFTNTLTADQVATLERKLVAYDDSTSNQIAIVIVPTTNDYAPVDYATKLGREWGIGNKKTNNGVLVLIAKTDRQIFIAPGYGLEGALPDITCKSIIDNEIRPNFRGEDYFRDWIWELQPLCELLQVNIKHQRVMAVEEVNQVVVVAVFWELS